MGLKKITEKYIIKKIFCEVFFTEYKKCYNNIYFMYDII